MKSKIIKIVLTITVFVMLLIWYSHQIVYPLSEFQRLGQFQFPLGTSVETWSEDSISISGIFRIDNSQAEKFTQDMKLEKREISGKILYIASRCYNNNNNKIEVEFDPEMSLVKIKIHTPDFSGDKPCL